MNSFASGLSRLALGVVLLLATACATRRGPTPSPFAEGSQEIVLLTVDNQDYRDATIYADWNGVRQRVGFVIGKTTETFSMPWRDYEVRFAVDFVGGGGLPLGERISVWAGEHIDFIIMPGW
jgi:hypothetical protein